MSDEVMLPAGIDDVVLWNSIVKETFAPYYGKKLKQSFVRQLYNDARRIYNERYTERLKSIAEKQKAADSSARLTAEVELSSLRDAVKRAINAAGGNMSSETTSFGDYTHTMTRGMDASARKALNQAAIDRIKTYMKRYPSDKRTAVNFYRELYPVLTTEEVEIYPHPDELEVRLFGDRTGGGW